MPNDKTPPAAHAPHCRTEEIPLTDEQRKLLSVTRDVSIPGVPEAPAPEREVVVCPACGAGEDKVSTAAQREEVPYGSDGKTVSVVLAVHSCAACGQSWTDHQAEVIRDFAVAEAMHADGVTPTVPTNRPATMEEAQHAAQIGACLPNGVLFDAAPASSHEVKLPPVPEHDEVITNGYGSGHSDHQLQEYARRAVLEDRAARGVKGPEHG